MKSICGIVLTVIVLAGMALNSCKNSKPAGGAFVPASGANIDAK